MEYFIGSIVFKIDVVFVKFEVMEKVKFKWWEIMVKLFDLIVDVSRNGVSFF